MDLEALIKRYILLIIGIGNFLLKSLIISFTLVFGGNIYEEKHSVDRTTGEVNDYTLIGDLKISFYIMLVCVGIYLYLEWRKKQKKEKESLK